jgi:hypothetical protein
MSFKAKWYSDKFAKKRDKGFRGFPVATIASVGIVANQGADSDPLEKWFSETIDVRTDPSVMEAVVRFIEQHGAKSVVALDRIIGCPHEEGIDYPEGEECPKCSYWANRDRWTGEVVR